MCSHTIVSLHLASLAHQLESNESKSFRAEAAGWRAANIQERSVCVTPPPILSRLDCGRQLREAAPAAVVAHSSRARDAARRRNALLPSADRPSSKALRRTRSA
jgi:hypothetical protein